MMKIVKEEITKVFDLSVDSIAINSKSNSEFSFYLLNTTCMLFPTLFILHYEDNLSLSLSVSLCLCIYTVYMALFAIVAIPYWAFSIHPFYLYIVIQIYLLM